MFFTHDGEKIRWVSQYKYLSYLVSPKIGRGFFLKDMMLKARNRISLIRSFRLFSCSSFTYMGLPDFSVSISEAVV